MNAFQRFLSEYGERRKIEEIPPAELDSLYVIFTLQRRKKVKQNTNRILCPLCQEASSATWMITTLA